MKRLLLCHLVILVTVLITNAQCPSITGPLDFYVCNGVLTGILPTSSEPGTTYSWTPQTGSITPGVTGAVAGSGSNIKVTLSNSGSSLGLVKYSVTPFANGCEGPSVTLRVHVVPTPTATASDKTVCSSESFYIPATPSLWPSRFMFRLESKSSNLQTTSYTLGNNYFTDGLTNPGQIASGEKLVNNSAELGYATYTIVPYFYWPANSCGGTPITVIVTVKPAPIVNSIDLTSVCSEENFSAPLSINLPGTATFNWNRYHYNLSGYEGMNPLPGSGLALTGPIINSETTVGSVRYDVKAVLDGCVGPIKDIEIFVKPIPDIVNNKENTQWELPDRNFWSGYPDSFPISANVPGTTFSWTFESTPGVSGATSGSGSTVSQTLTYNASLIPPKENDHGTVTYFVTPTAEGCIGEVARFYVYVWPVPPAVISASGSTTFCQGGSVTLNANTAAGNNYQWRRNGIDIGGAILASYTATQSGYYTVYITNDLYEYPNNLSNGISVNVNSTPTATIAPASSTTFCQGGSVRLDAPLGTDLTYAWRKNGGSTVLSTQSYYDAIQTGSYTVTVSNALCSKVSVPTEVMVNPIPTATITSSGSTTLCSNQSVTLQANTGTGLTYKWYLSDVLLSSTGSSVVVPFTNPGTYKVVIKNSNNCENIASVMVTSINVNIEQIGTFCTGGSVTLLSVKTPSPFPGDYTYKWQRYTQQVFNIWQWVDISSFYSVSVNTAGKYRVIVTYNDGSYSCNSTSAEYTLTALSNPKPTIGYSGDVCLNGYVTLNTSSASSYLWSTGATTQSTIGYEGGTYNVRVTHANGCSNTSNWFTVPTCQPDPCEPQINAAGRVIEPPCLEEAQKAEVIITSTTAYPNPSDKELIVHLPSPAEYDIPVKMYSQFGQVIQSAVIQKGESKVLFDTKDLTGGVYLIQIQLRGQKSFNRKVMVVHRN